MIEIDFVSTYLSLAMFFGILSKFDILDREECSRNTSKNLTILTEKFDLVLI